MPLPQAEIEEANAIETFDNYCWLLSEIRQALEPITPDGRIISVVETKATIETAVELLKELNHPDITALADDLQEKTPELIAPLEWLEQQLASVRQDLDVDTVYMNIGTPPRTKMVASARAGDADVIFEAETFVMWAWRHRQDLNLNIATDFPENLRPIAYAVWDAFSLFHRSSSLAESLHSWLRPYLQIHRGMPKWLLPLLQLFWNHHEFERGKRVGSSPLELAGVEDVPSLAEVLDRLFHPSVAAQPA